MRAGRHPVTSEQGSPWGEPMPMEAPVLPARTWLAGWIVHRDLPVGAPEVDVKVDGKLTLAILDSGSAVTLVLVSYSHPTNGV